MFGYLTPTAGLAEFERLKEALEYNTELIDGAFDDRVSINYEKTRLLQQQIQDYIHTIKTTPITDDTVKTQIDDITPLTRQLREAMWPTCFVESTDGGNVVLVQRAKTIESFEVTTSAFSVGVERFDVGNQRPKGHTIRSRTSPPLSASKTRRRSPESNRDEPVPHSPDEPPPGWVAPKQEPPNWPYSPDEPPPGWVAPKPAPRSPDEPSPAPKEPELVESIKPTERMPSPDKPEPNMAPTGPEWIPNTGKRCPPGYLVDRKDKTRCIKKK
jgi:hypothetical protein